MPRTGFMEAEGRGQLCGFIYRQRPSSRRLPGADKEVRRPRMIVMFLPCCRRGDEGVDAIENSDSFPRAQEFAQSRGRLLSIQHAGGDIQCESFPSIRVQFFVWQQAVFAQEYE